MTLDIAILGASGYTGAELVRLLATHPEHADRRLGADRKAGERMASVFPHLRHLDLPTAPAAIEDIDFSGDRPLLLRPAARDHAGGVAALPRDLKIVDLSADFRLRDPAVYAEWYGHEHRALDLQAEAVYGLTEFYRDEIRRARLVAGTGCNSATGIYAVLPLLEAGLIDPDEIIIDLATGVSGAGRSPRESMLYAEVAEGYHAYNIAKHRHMAEFDQEFSKAAGRPVTCTFTAHLLPQNRGILATIYVKGDAQAIHGALADRYAARALRRRPAIWRGAGDAACPRLELRACRRRGRPRAGPGDRLLGARQPLQGLVRSGDPEREPHARPRRDRRADGGAALPVKLWGWLRGTAWPFLDAVGNRFIEDEGWVLSGHLAFSGMLALIPFLIFATALTGLVIGPEGGQAVLEELFHTVPDYVAQDARAGRSIEVAGQRRGGLLTISALGAIWAASNGIEALRVGFDRAYDVEAYRHIAFSWLIAVGDRHRRLRHLHHAGGAVHPGADRVLAVRVVDAAPHIPFEADMIRYAHRLPRARPFALGDALDPAVAADARAPALAGHPRQRAAVDPRRRRSSRSISSMRRTTR